MTTVTVTLVLDLVDVIKQSVDQVWGSDERELLRKFLARNTEEKQVVTIEVDLVRGEKDE